MRVVWFQRHVLSLRGQIVYEWNRMEKKEPKSILEEQIEENLRKVYKEKEAEVIPDRLLALLRQLKEQDDANGTS